jgi:hypothetical protein
LEYAGGDRGWIGDNPYIFLDTKRIAATGWKPKLTIKQGIVKTLRDGSKPTDGSTKRVLPRLSLFRHPPKAKSLQSGYLRSCGLVPSHFDYPCLDLGNGARQTPQAAPVNLEDAVFYFGLGRTLHGFV